MSDFQLDILELDIHMATNCQLKLFKLICLQPKSNLFMVMNFAMGLHINCNLHCMRDQCMLVLL